MKIVVASTQYPYYGGAATNSYALLKYLRSYNHEVAGIFFEPQRVNVDPDKIGGIWRIDIGNSKAATTKRVIANYLGGYPDMVLGKNYAAPIHAKKIFPDSRIIYLVTGSPQMTQLSEKNISATKHLSSKAKGFRFEPEHRCIMHSDVVIPNSPIARRMLIKNYGPIGKIYSPIDTSLAFNNRISSNKPFETRQYDIAFICSNMNRKVKNAPLAKKLFNDPRLKNFNKVAVGNNSAPFGKIKNTVIHNLLPQKKMISILEDTKVVICPSFYDASPNIIKEAIMSGCNVLASKNCGWSENYPKEFICSDIYKQPEWAIKCLYLINNEVNHNFKFDKKKLITDINNL